MAQSTAPATMNEMYEQCFPCSAETAKKNLSSKSSLPMMKGYCTALRHMDSYAAQKSLHNPCKAFVQQIPAQICHKKILTKSQDSCT